MVEPLPEDQSAGTQVVLAYRGASTVGSSMNGAPAFDAMDLDAYGDQPDVIGAASPGNPIGKNADVVFLDPADSSWKNDLDAIDGARFVQLRVTFISNAESGLTPELGALGIPFREGTP